MKYKNSEIKCKNKVKSRNGKKLQHRPGKKDNNNNNNNSNRLYWKVHSKRNNLVFWNVPEGDEKEKGCVQFIEDFLENHMKIPELLARS